MDTNLNGALTPKQQVFCNEYLVDMNATRAALRAGYSAATALNGQLMQMPKIKWYLQEHLAAATAKAEFTHDRVLRELGKIAFGSMSNYFDEQGGLKPMHEISGDDKAALWSVSVSDAGSGGKPGAAGLVKLRMYNKLSALDKIAKHIGFYKPDVKPVRHYVYLNEADMTADDRFEDKSMEPKAESGELLMKSGDPDVKSGDEAFGITSADDLEEPLEEDEAVLCDGAGIPYETTGATLERGIAERAATPTVRPPEIFSNRITDEERAILTKQMPTFCLPGFSTNGYSYAEIIAHAARVKEIKTRMKVYGLVV